MKKLILFKFVIFYAAAVAQTGVPFHVVNSAGNERSSATLFLTDNVGEPFIQTIKGNSTNITQGFLQPEVSSKIGFTLSSIFQSIMCMDKEDDAFIALTVAPAVSNQTVTYLWTPANVCPNNDCPKIDSLRPGIYNVAVAIAYKARLGYIMYDTLRPAQFTIDNATTPCLIKVYNGITANGDGINDVLEIDNIKEFPDNRVTIYNRWGEKLFEVNGYDHNVTSRSWPGGEINTLAASTYFYIIELGKGYKPVKGWVELLKN